MSTPRPPSPAPSPVPCTSTHDRTNSLTGEVLQSADGLCIRHIQRHVHTDVGEPLGILVATRLAIRGREGVWAWQKQAAASDKLAEHRQTCNSRTSCALLYLIIRFRSASLYAVAQHSCQHQLWHVATADAIQCRPLPGKHLGSSWTCQLWLSDAGSYRLACLDSRCLDPHHPTLLGGYMTQTYAPWPTTLTSPAAALPATHCAVEQQRHLVVGVVPDALPHDAGCGPHCGLEVGCLVVLRAQRRQEGLCRCASQTVNLQNNTSGQVWHAVLDRLSFVQGIDRLLRICCLPRPDIAVLTSSSQVPSMLSPASMRTTICSLKISYCMPCRAGVRC